MLHHDSSSCYQFLNLEREWTSYDKDFRVEIVPQSPSNVWEPVDDISERNVGFFTFIKILLIILFCLSHRILQDAFITREGLKIVQRVT